jgi:hypothetical protein
VLGIVPTGSAHKCEALDVRPGLDSFTSFRNRSIPGTDPVLGAWRMSAIKCAPIHASSAARTCSGVNGM